MQHPSLIGILASTVTAVSVAVCAAVVALPPSRYNIVTPTEIDFEAMLHNDRYSHWLLFNLRCSQATFHGLTAILCQYMKDYSLGCSSHSFE
jgi:hypothetical protein